MSSTKKVTGVIVFGVLISITLPYLINMGFESKLENETKTETQTTTTSTNEVAMVTLKDESGTPVETTVEEEEVIEEEETEEEETVEVVEETQAEPIVYDGMTLNELAEKLNRSLSSTLSGTGLTFATYAIEMGIDPYLAVAIVLHETGCSYSCSNAVVNYNNVGGMYSGGSLISFDTLEDGIYSFMKNLKENYYDKGLTTAEQINTKYATSTSWASKVNSYISKIKAA